MKPRLYKGTIINPVSRLKTEVIPDAALVVDEGRILAVLPFTEAVRAYPDHELVDLSGRYLAPGFIDVHLHAPQVNQRARYGASLMEWLTRYIFKAEEEFGDLRTADRGIRMGLNEMIRNGTTTAVMYSSHHREATDLLFTRAAESGIRAFIGKVLMDFNLTGPAEETTEAAIRESLELRDKWDGHDRGRLQYVFTPRFAPVCSPDLLRELGRLNRSETIRIQSHLAENPAEIAEALDIHHGHASYTEIYEKAGILGPRTIMAHCIHMSEREFGILKETGTRIAHCPSSNFFLKSGRFDLRQAERLGLSLGLGTDVGAGPSFSLCDVMRSMNFMQPHHILPQKAYYHATLGNAELLGLEAGTGNLLPGKDADFIVINVNRNYPDFTFHNVEDLLAFLIYLGHANFIEAAYVRGRRLELFPVDQFMPSAVGQERVQNPSAQPE
jgi:guanine deaminase